MFGLALDGSELHFGGAISMLGEIIRSTGLQEGPRDTCKPYLEISRLKVLFHTGVPRHTM